MATEKTEEQKRLEEERKIEEAQARHKALVSVQEAAAGMQYTEPMKSSWAPPKHIREQSEDEHQAIRQKFHIILEGNNPVPPIKHFPVMRLIFIEE
jgi:ATP-dependent RNA helicase DDX41